MLAASNGVHTVAALLTRVLRKAGSLVPPAVQPQWAGFGAAALVASPGGGPSDAAELVASLQRAAPEHGAALVELGEGESVIKCPSPPNVLKYTYDHSCY